MNKVPASESGADLANRHVDDGVDVCRNLLDKRWVKGDVAATRNEDQVGVAAVPCAGRDVCPALLEVERVGEPVDQFELRELGDL